MLGADSADTANARVDCGARGDDVTDDTAALPGLPDRAQPRVRPARHISRILYAHDAGWWHARWHGQWCVHHCGGIGGAARLQRVVSSAAASHC